MAVAEPVGYVISEKTHPIQQLGAEAAGGHYGISQVMFLGPESNSEASIIALVQYAPGGNTPVHYHPNMEQIEIVLEGKALWEVGEFEREVGPGDVIFTPRFVKHGYKVLGTSPSSFCSWSGGTSKTSPRFSSMVGNVGSQSTKGHEGKKISTKGHEGPRRDTKKNTKEK